MQIGAVHEDYGSDHQQAQIQIASAFVKPGLVCFIFIAYAIMIQARVQWKDFGFNKDTTKTLKLS